VITPRQAQDIRTRNEALNKWIDTIRNKKTGWASYKPEDKPEVFEFVTNPPDKYFLYINDTNRTATTWTGEKLGNVGFGCEYRDNFGGKRVPITVYAINSRTYHGTYYKSSGDYARIRAKKGAR
jgi:hypothetical protein